MVWRLVVLVVLLFECMCSALQVCSNRGPNAWLLPEYCKYGPDRQRCVRCPRVYVLMCPVGSTRTRLPAANARQALAGLLPCELCLHACSRPWLACVPAVLSLFGFLCWCKMTGVLVNHVHMCCGVVV